MKKIVLLLIAAPLFLITSMNFYGEGDNDNHPPYQKSFTCSSCHFAISDDVIIGGKTFKDSLYQNISVRFPANLVYGAIQISVTGVKDPKISNVSPYRQGDFGSIFNLSLNSASVGKKANQILIRIPLDEIEPKQEIEIQGVLTNADGTNEGEFSFYKKIVLKEIETPKQKLLFYPTIVKTHLNIKNIEPNSSIYIYNINGELVYQCVSDFKKKTIEMNNLPNGNYFVKIANTTKKIIVSK